MIGQHKTRFDFDSQSKKNDYFFVLLQSLVRKSQRLEDIQNKKKNLFNFKLQKEKRVTIYLFILRLFL